MAQQDKQAEKLEEENRALQRENQKLNNKVRLA